MPKCRPNFACGGGAQLDGVGDVGQPRSVDHCGDAGLQRQPGRFAEICVCLGDLADTEGPGRVAVPAVKDRTAVDRHEVAVGDDHLGAGDAVHDDVVDRAADRPRESVVALERGHCSRVADHRFGDAVQLQGGNSRLGGLTHGDQCGAHHGTGCGHRVEFTRRTEQDDTPTTEPDHGGSGYSPGASASTPSEARTRRCTSWTSPTASIEVTSEP